MDGPAADDGERRGGAGEVVEIGGQRVGGIGDQVGVFAGGDAAQSAGATFPLEACRASADTGQVIQQAPD